MPRFRHFSRICLDFICTDFSAFQQYKLSFKLLFLGHLNRTAIGQSHSKELFPRIDPVTRYRIARIDPVTR
jgi:hypothetical protein